MRVQFFGGPPELHLRWQRCQTPLKENVVIVLNSVNDFGVATRYKRCHYVLGAPAEFDVGYYYVRDIPDEERIEEDE